jgi:TonB family protein
LEPEKETSISTRLQRGILLSIFFVFILIPVAHAQLAQAQGLAPGVTEALTKAKVRNIAVFDFMGPGQRLNQLGRDLADEFSRELAKSGGKFQVIERSAVNGVIEANRVAPDVIRDPEIAWWFARQLNAEALLVGKLSPAEDNKLRIVIAAAKTKGGDEIANISVVIPFTDEMMTRLSKSLCEDHMKDTLDPHTPNEFFPKCIYCPRAEYPAPAMAHAEEGTVFLIVQVTEDGFAKDIEFVEGMPYGMTQKAIEAVKKWKFQPGRGPDGKPRPVWQKIQVTFHLMK